MTMKKFRALQPGDKIETENGCHLTVLTAERATWIKLKGGVAWDIVTDAGWMIEDGNDFVSVIE